MRSKVVRTLALALTLGSVSFGMAQQPSLPAMPGARIMPPQGGKPASEKSKLEAMLAEALRNNPDIRVAAAKLAEADAELNRTRLQVTQKVVTLYHAIETQKKIIEQHELQIQLQTTAVRSARAGSGWEKVTEAQLALALAKGKLAELEAQLPAVLGNKSRTAGVEIPRPPSRMAFSNDGLRLYLDLDTDNDVRVIPHKASGPLAERIRKALQTSVKVDYKNVPFKDVLKDLEKKAPGLSFRDVIIQDKEPNVTLHFEETLPVSAILQALTDDDCGFHFVVRDYGIRVMPMNRRTPPDALTVEQFLRQKPPEK